MTPARLAEIRKRLAFCESATLGGVMTFALYAEHVRDLLLALDAATAERDAARKDLRQSVADYRAESAEHGNTIKEFAQKDIALRKCESVRDVALARAEAAEQEIAKLHAEIARHVSPDNENVKRGFYVAALRDLAQSNISAIGNCETLESEIARLRALTTWRPIAKCDVRSKSGEDRKRVFVYGDMGVQVGYVIDYGDGTQYAAAEGFHGDWTVTHWQPLPVPPATTDEEGA